MDDGQGGGRDKGTGRFRRGNAFGRGRPPKAPDAVLSALEGLADKTSAEKVQALEGLVGAWIAKAADDRDRASLIREAVALFRLGAELRREIRVAGTADTNILIVERDRARGELEARGREWDAEAGAIVGALAPFPDARRAVVAALARARAHAEHDRSGGPGYPALPAPAEEEAEAVPPRPAAAGQGAEGAGVPLPAEKGGPAAERPAPAPADQRGGSGPEGQEGLRRTTADIGGGARSPLPPGMWRESGTPSARRRGGNDLYGDGGPLTSQD